MFERRVHWVRWGILAVILGTVVGCRSASADRIRELEAKRADLERRNRDLRDDAARSREAQLKADADLERRNAELDALQKRMQMKETAAAPEAGVGGDLKRELEGKGIEIVDRGGGQTALVLGSNVVNFAAGRADLDERAMDTLRLVARALKETRGIREVRVEGHTDSDPIRRSGWKSNEQLSEARAAKVRAYLVAQGVSEDTLTVEGHGAAKPVLPNTSVANKAKNRRVEIVLLSSSGK